MLSFQTTHNLLPLASVPGPVSAPQIAPFFWPLQLNVLTPDTLQESRNSGLLTLMRRKVYIYISLYHKHRHMGLCQDMSLARLCIIILNKVAQHILT